ncbi:uncharacterized protein [Musca autumnalis]|uniref:uncharacterized protein n=1 Tax=Musca autumnalis TaxID=221902 RepID=UPI003CF4BE10
MPALYSDISGHLEFFNLSSSDLKEHKNQDNTDAFIIMVEDLEDLNRASLASEAAAAAAFNDDNCRDTMATGSSSSVPMRCGSLDSCLSRDQFLISMVNEFLNDADDTVMDEPSSAGKTNTPLNIVEYMEEPNQNEVESLIDFHHIKDLQTSPTRHHEDNNTPPPIEIVMPPCGDSPPSLFVNMAPSLPVTTNVISFSNSSSTSSSLASVPVMATTSKNTTSLTSTTTSATTTTTTTNFSSSSTPKLLLTDRSHESSTEMPTILLTIKNNENLTANMREISYQRFGRINRNLPAEVHNFRCHLCAFSCKRKELLLQHFRERHPT